MRACSTSALDDNGCTAKRSFELNSYSPSLDWGHELVLSLVWVLKTGVITMRGPVGRRGADCAVHHLGQAVLADHRRLLQGPPEPPGVGNVRRAAVAGHHGSAHPGAGQLLQQRPVFGPAGRVSGRRRGQRRGPELRRAWLLDGDLDVLRDRDRARHPGQCWTCI